MNVTFFSNNYIFILSHISSTTEEVTSHISGIPLAAQEKIMSSKSGKFQFLFSFLSLFSQFFPVIICYFVSIDLWTISNHPYQFLLETKLDLEAYVLLIVVC